MGLREIFFPPKRDFVKMLKEQAEKTAEGMQALRLSKIGKRRQLIYRSSPLTSERLRAIIDCAILQASGLAANTIVAGGKQGCDPHERGHGPLRANEAIVLDIFPRHARNYYYGDLTRTVVRGRASDAE